MSRFLTPIQILDGKVPERYDSCKIAGTSLTIPGQGSDLAQIISSVVKLPPIDDRSFDVPMGGALDPDALALKTQLDSMYFAEQQNAGLDAQERRRQRTNAQNEGTPAGDGGEAEERSDENETK